MELLNDTVLVMFLDDISSETITTLNLSIANRPEPLELETTFNLGDAEWSVIHAEPSKKRDVSKSGKLTLRLRQIVKVNFSDLLDSLPSICDRLPAVANSPPAGDDLILAEDDLRQIELVSRLFATDVPPTLDGGRLIGQDSGLSINSCNRGASSGGTVATVDWSIRPMSMKSSR